MANELYRHMGMFDNQFNDPPPDARCPSCMDFEEVNYSGWKYKCSGPTDCKASELATGHAYKGQCQKYRNKNDPSNQAILDRKPRPKIVTLLITGLIVSVIWAVAIIIYGNIKSGLVIDSPFILTMVSGIPAGTVAFTLLRLLKNVVNKGVTKFGEKAGGNLLGWIVSTLLPYAAPAIAYFILAGVFGANIM